MSEEIRDSLRWVRREIDGVNNSLRSDAEKQSLLIGLRQYEAELLTELDRPSLDDGGLILEDTIAEVHAGEVVAPLEVVEQLGDDATERQVEVIEAEAAATVEVVEAQAAATVEVVEAQAAADAERIEALAEADTERLEAASETVDEITADAEASPAEVEAAAAVVEASVTPDEASVTPDEAPVVDHWWYRQLGRRD